MLVPGCGLGRLPFEIARLGYACQGNEFSHHMLLVSQYFMNGLSGDGQLSRVAASPFMDHKAPADASPAARLCASPVPFNMRGFTSPAPTTASIGRPGAPSGSSKPPAVGPGGAFPGGLPGLSRSIRQLRIHPWAMRPTNQLHPVLQARPVMVPDVDPAQELEAMMQHAEAAASAVASDGAQAGPSASIDAAVSTHVKTSAAGVSMRGSGQAGMEPTEDAAAVAASSADAVPSGGADSKATTGTIEQGLEGPAADPRLLAAAASGHAVEPHTETSPKP